MNEHSDPQLHNMSELECFHLWGTQEKWEDPLLCLLEFPLRNNGAKQHFDKWLRDGPSENERGKSVLINILDATKAFQRNLNVCKEVAQSYCKKSTPTSAGDCSAVSPPKSVESQNHPNARPTWLCRLFPLLRRVILQHLDLFDLFWGWLAKAEQEAGQKKAATSGLLSEIGKLDDAIRDQLEESTFNVQSLNDAGRWPFCLLVQDVMLIT